MARQTKPSKSWAISSGFSVGGGKGKVGVGASGLFLFDVESQLFISLLLKGGSLGGGIPGLTLSTFQPAFFTTSKSLFARDFDGLASLAGAEATIGVGGAVSYLTFWNVDHDPYWLDVGGLQYGVSGGVAAGLYRATTFPNDARENKACIIAPGGDELCGGSSKPGPNYSHDPGMSR